MERLTEQGATYGSCEFMDDGIHEWINRLSAYEDTELTPEEITKLRKELADKARWLDLYFGQLRNASERIKKYDTSERKLQADCDYWEREAKQWCGKLGEIRILAETHIHNTP